MARRPEMVADPWFTVLLYYYRTLHSWEDCSCCSHADETLIQILEKFWEERQEAVVRVTLIAPT